MVFYFYKEDLQFNINKVPRVEAQVVDLFKDIIHFEETPHHIYIQGRRDLYKEWLLG